MSVEKIHIETGFDHDLVNKHQPIRFEVPKTIFQTKECTVEDQEKILKIEAEYIKGLCPGYRWTRSTPIKKEFGSVTYKMSFEKL